VELLSTALEPQPASYGKRGRLAQFLEAEQLPEKPTRLGLTAGRCGKLHVVDPFEQDRR
jgi:hypothetical protein